jgi:hypothetical protein
VAHQFGAGKVIINGAAASFVYFYFIASVSAPRLPLQLYAWRADSMRICIGSKQKNGPHISWLMAHKRPRVKFL